MRVTIETGNAAFHEVDGAKGIEVARILRDLADRVEEQGCPAVGEFYTVRDFNGNAVGTAVGR